MSDEDSPQGDGPGTAERRPASGSPPARLRLSLKLKLSLLIAILLIITLALVSAFLLHLKQTKLTAEMTKRGLTIARDLAASAKNPIVTHDELSLNLLVKDALKDEDVVYLVITDQDGKVLAHSDLSLVGKPLERRRPLAPLAEELLVQAYTDPALGPLIDFAVPLVFSKVRVGALYLGFSRRSIGEALVKARNETILISVVMVLAGIGGAVALSTALSRPILRLVDATRAIAGGNYNVALAVTSRDEIGALTESFNQMATSLREKEMIKQAFSRYVSREVVEEVLKDPERAALKGERREVTVLFCDIRRFTPLAARLRAEEVVSLLNEFYALMVDTTLRYDGTLDKFLGDGVMVVFGAPIRHGDHSLRAIRTALAMQAGVVELSQRRLREGKEPINVGIGVNTGVAVAGTVGTEERMEYTVIGRHVNLAARLEEFAKPGQILISRQTYKAVRASVLARSQGVVQLRDEEEPVEVYEILGLTGEA